MNTLTLEDICYRVSDAEEKLPSLRMRNIKRLKKLLSSIPFAHMALEGYEFKAIQQIGKDLTLEQWVLEDIK